MPVFAATEVSIGSAACRFPQREVSVADLFAEEGVELDDVVADRLGVDSVRLCAGETGTDLALAAASEALELAGLEARQLDLIVDYTVLPQEYLVPAWSMGNKLQAELGAKRAFTLGFSGGGATSFQLSLQAAASLLAGDEGLDTALLVAADVTIPGNRVLHPRRPISVLGDSASALVLRRGAAGDAIVAIGIETEGALHDVYCIRGGAMRHPERTDLYRLEIDAEGYAASGRIERLCSIAERLLDEAGLGAGQVRAVDYTNISAEDRGAFLAALGARGVGSDGASPHRGAGHGHLQGTDLVLNYLGARERLAAGELLLVASHGMGFMYGATLIRRAPAGARQESAS